MRVPSAHSAVIVAVSPLPAMANRISPSRPNCLPSKIPEARPSVETLARFAVAAPGLGASGFASSSFATSGFASSGFASPSFAVSGLAPDSADFISSVLASSAFASGAFSPSSGVQVALSEPSFGSSVMCRSFAIGFGVAPLEVTANFPAASTGAAGGSSTGAPATNMASNLVSESKGSPAATMRFASFPFSSVPTRALMPSSVAGVVVSAASASSLVSPWAIASPRRLRNEPLSCMRWVVNATVVPAAMKRLGLVGA